MSQLSNICLILIALFVGLHITNGCEFRDMKFGCRIQNARCVCGTVCPDKSFFASRNGCLSALRGSRRDICAKTPCENEGECLKVTQEPGFKCRCEGTGFHGQRCSKLCPTQQEVAEGVSFPYECIVI